MSQSELALEMMNGFLCWVPGFLCWDSWAHMLNVAITDMMTHKLADNIDGLLETKRPAGFSKQRSIDDLKSRWSDL